MLKRIILIALLTTFSNFGYAYAEHHHHSKTSDIKKTSTKNTGLTAKLSPIMDSYPKMKPVNLTLNLNYEKKALEKATVSMDLTMPGMYMPQNIVKFKETKKGIYEGTAMFTMSGDWRLNTSIIMGKVKETTYFDIKVD